MFSKTQKRKLIYIDDFLKHKTKKMIDRIDVLENFNFNFLPRIKSYIL